MMTSLYGRMIETTLKNPKYFQGKRNRKYDFSVSAGDSYASAVRFRNCLGNGKPEPVMISLAVAYLVETIEPFKQTRLLFLWDFLPAVLYRKDSIPPVPAKG